MRSARPPIAERRNRASRRYGHALDLLRTLPLESIVERGGDGGDGLNLAGVRLRQAGGETKEDEDKRGCCSQHYAPLTLRFNSALVADLAGIGAVTLTLSSPTGSRTMPSPARHASKRLSMSARSRPPRETIP